MGCRISDSPIFHPSFRETIKPTISPAAAVADTTDPGNTAAQLNALLASLRAAGLLAT